MKKDKLIALLMSLIVTVGFFSLYVVRVNKKSLEQTVENKLTPVEATNIKKGEISQYQKFTGKTKGGQEENISPQVLAKVKSLKVEEGDNVKAGDIIMTFDTTDIDEQVSKAKEAYEKVDEAMKASSKQLEEMKNKLTDVNKDISTNKNIVEASTKENTELKSKLENLSSLVASGEISSEEFDTQKSEIENKIKANTSKISEATKKMAELEMTKATLEKTLNGMSGSSNSNEQVAELKKMYDTTLESRENYIVKASISGQVKNLNVQEGESVMSMFGPALTITNTDTMDFDIQVNKDDLDKFKKGQEIQVNVDSKDGMLEVEGKVENISDSTDKKTGQYTVTINIPNNDNEIEINNYASAMIPSNTKKDILIVDKNALIRENDKVYVYTLNNDSVSKVEVEIGLENDTKVEIISGLSEDDSVITKGKEFISNGEKVNVVRGNE